VARGDLGVDHQHALGGARAHGVDGHLQREGSRRAGHVHVEGKTAGAQGTLDLDSHGRVGALHVRGRADHGVDVGAGLASGGHGLLRGVDGDLGHQRQLVIRALLQAGVHPVDVQDAFLLHHIALLDARRLLDEFGAGRRQGRHGAGFDVGSMVGVEPGHVGVERLDQFVVGDGVGRLEQARPADDNCAHVAIRLSQNPRFCHRSSGGA